MLRVLHCIYDDIANPWLGGGAAHRVREIYRRLSDRLDVTVAMGSYPGVTEAVSEGVRYRPIGAPAPYAWSRLTYAAAASRMLRNEEYDVGVFDFSVYTPLRVPEGRPIAHVVHMLIGPTARSRWGALVGALVERRERATLARARRVQTTSQWMAGRLAGLVAPAADIRIVPTGVDDAFFDVARDESDYVLYYGRFDVYQKGLDSLFATLEPLLRSRPSLRLVLAGRGRDAAELARMRRAHPLSGRIEIVLEPTRARVLNLLAGALVLLHPSRFEGLPAVPIEAMAAGVPVVATSVGGVAEIIGEGSGVLVPAEEPASLGQAADALLDDAERRRALSAGARAAARRFSWERVAALHFDHLRSIAAQEDGSPDPQRKTS